MSPARTPEDAAARVSEAAHEEAEAYRALKAEVNSASIDRDRAMSLARVYGLTCALHQLAVRDQIRATYDARLDAVLAAGTGERMAAVMAQPAEGRP